MKFSRWKEANIYLKVLLDRWPDKCALSPPFDSSAVRYSHSQDGREVTSVPASAAEYTLVTQVHPVIAKVWEELVAGSCVPSYRST